MESPIFLTPEQIREICNHQTKVRIESGFAQALGISEEELVGRYDQAVTTLVDSPVAGAIPAVVEPGIEFADQVSLLGLDMNPAVFYKPVSERDEPYGVWLQTIDKDHPLRGSSRTFIALLEQLPTSRRAANPFEGISIPQPLGDGKIFMLFPGGVCESAANWVRSGAHPINDGVNPMSLAVETYLGRTRISNYYLDIKMSSLGDMLVAVVPE